MDKITDEISQIPIIHFKFRALNSLKDQLDTSRSRIEQWLDHAAYAGATNPRNTILIYDSYRPDLAKIRQATERIEIEIKARQWPEHIRENHPIIYYTSVAFSRYFGTLSDLLSLFGLTDSVSSFLRNLIPLKLGAGHHNDQR